MNKLTGLKDIDREVLKHVSDKELLGVCSIDRRMWKDVCDENFLRRRMLRYTGIEEYKKIDESWKQFFLRFVYYTSKMREEYEFEYITGDFKTQYALLQKYIGNELLVESAKEGHLSLVQHSLKNGADIQTEEDAALKLASFKGHLDVVKYLVEQGADIHAGNDATLIWASDMGHLDVVKFLMEQGADIHAKDNLPLIWASRSGNLGVVKYLVSKGVDIHVRNDNALILASRNGHLEVVKYIIEQFGIEMNVLNDALRYASDFWTSRYCEISYFERC